MWAKPPLISIQNILDALPVFFIHANPCIMIIKSLVKGPLDSVRLYKNSNHPKSEQALLGKILYVSLMFNGKTFAAAFFLIADQLCLKINNYM